MTQKLPLRKGGGKTRPTRDATTLRLRDEPKGITDASAYNTRQSENIRLPSSQFDEEKDSSSVEVSNEDKINGRSSSSPNSESE